MINRTLTQLHPNVWRLVAENPSPMTGPGTNTYLVGQNQVAIIDPGPKLPAHIDNILQALQTLDVTPQAVIVTHPHPDHDEVAPEIADRLNAPLLRYGQPLQHGAEIELDCGRLQVYHTPGHIHAHICLWWAEQKILFGADLVAGEGTILIIPPDGDMADYLRSLAAMQALEAAVIFPGHGPVIEEPRQMLQHYIDHRLAREQQVLHGLAQGRTTAEAIAAEIYADQPPEVMKIAVLQVEAHLIKLRREGRA